MSTIEAELTALDTATVKAEWFCELLVDLPIVEKQIPTILIKLSRHIKKRLKSVRKLKNSDSNRLKLYSNS